MVERFDHIVPLADLRRAMGDPEPPPGTVRSYCLRLTSARRVHHAGLELVTIHRRGYVLRDPTTADPDSPPTA